VDCEDLAEALDALQADGIPSISGNPVKHIFVPALDVMYGEAVHMLRKLADVGIDVRVVDRMPRYAAENGMTMDTVLPTASLEEIRMTVSEDAVFPAPAAGGLVLRGQFEKDGKTIYMLVNKSRTDAVIGYQGNDGEIWNPSDGSICEVNKGSEITVPAMRALFVVS